MAQETPETHQPVSNNLKALLHTGLLSTCQHCGRTKMISVVNKTYEKK